MFSERKKKTDALILFKLIQLMIVKMVFDF